MSVERKNIKSISWLVDEPTYRADHAISYSTLSRFEREGWRKLSSLFDRIESPSLAFGSAVDTLLTDGPDAFKEQFIVCEFPSISDSLIQIARDLHSKFKNEHRKVSTISDAEINVVALENNYYVNPKYASYRVKNIRESCDEYYALLTLAQDKTIISQSDYDDVLNCASELRNNPATKFFFTSSPWDDQYEKVFQLKFKGEYNGIPVRCMFDEIIVDYKNKIIYPIDLKTTGHPEEDFEGSFAMWRYDIQAKLYTYILNQICSQDPYFKNFKIVHYQFIVINRRTVAPMVWNFKGNFGEMDLKDDKGNIYRDWRKILIDLNYYLNSPTMRYRKDILENNCIMDIKSLK